MALRSDAVHVRKIVSTCDAISKVAERAMNENWGGTGGGGSNRRWPLAAKQCKCRGIGSESAAANAVDLEMESLVRFEGKQSLL